jgi:BlaI family transcriptional regulator, penicillinase repressor
MRRETVELTEAQWAIIKAVWDAEPCTATKIQQHLHKATRWTYSTVRTLMDRKEAKGLLSAERERNQTLYRSVVTRAQAQRSELGYALKHAFNGALAPMVQCLIETAPLSAEDLSELELLIKAKKKGSRK